ncbi:YugN family protein [Brevibacillus sp. SYSU BS000544]|uniref:YugN family protein n=1 Tax=Brevibacillus sp. SYSU BS000544 TaxID=3416443 RepID=UPI003CE58E34
MVIKDTGIGGKESHLGELDHIMDELGFVRWAWDYNHATYDFKIEDKGSVFYLRVQADAVKGKLEDPHTLLKLEDPFMGKATFPHGLDYDAQVPPAVVETAKRKLGQLKDKL